MAFLDRIESVVIGSLADGASSLLDRRPAEAESGWDSMRDRWLLRNDAAGTDPHTAIASFMARGTQISGKTMWVSSRTPRTLARGIFEVEVVSLGLLSTRGTRVRYDAGANSTQASNVTVPAVGFFPKVEAQESQVTCDIEYIVTSGPTPASASFYTKAVGTATDPPSPWKPAVKDSIWATMSDPTYHTPNGWVLMSSAAENLPGLSTVWLVRDRYQYIYAYSP
jgi:hypothetical protein